MTLWNMHRKKPWQEQMWWPFISLLIGVRYEISFHIRCIHLYRVFCSLLVLYIPPPITTCLVQPCRGFTPVLTAQYAEWKKQGDKVEVVFVSSGMLTAQRLPKCLKLTHVIVYILLTVLIRNFLTFRLLRFQCQCAF